MTVAALIEALQKFPGENEVTVRVLDDGFADEFEDRAILAVATFSADHPSGEDGCPIVIELGETVAA